MPHFLQRSTPKTKISLVWHDRHLGAVTSPASWYTINPVLTAFPKLKPLPMKMKTISGSTIYINCGLHTAARLILDYDLAHIIYPKLYDEESEYIHTSIRKTRCRHTKQGRRIRNDKPTNKRS